MRAITRGSGRLPEQAHILVHPEPQPALIAKGHVLFAGDKRRRRAGHCSDASADQRTFAACSESSNQGTAAGSTTNPAPITLLVRTSACRNPRRAEVYDLLVDGDPI